MSAEAGEWEFVNCPKVDAVCMGMKVQFCRAELSWTGSRREFMRYSRIKKRLLWAVIILTVAAILAGAVFFYQRQRGEKGDLLSEHGNRKETVNLWYTDEIGRAHV